MDAADIAVNFFCNGTLLFRGTGDLGIHVVDGTHLMTNPGQSSFRLAGLVHRGAGKLPTAFHNLGRLAGARLQVSNHLLNFPGGILGPRCQRPYFVGHDSESSSMGAGACRLDRSIQRQQVGLFGDGVDHLDDLFDIGAVLGHALHSLCCLLQGFRQLSDGGRGFLHHAITALHFDVGFLGGGCRAGGKTRHFVHRGGHLVHRRGHLFRLGRLETYLSAVVIRSAFKFRGGSGELFSGRPYFPDNAAQSLHSVLQRAHHAIRVPCPELLVQLTIGQLTNGPGNVFGLTAKNLLQSANDHQCHQGTQNHRETGDGQVQRIECTRCLANLIHATCNHLFLVINKGIYPFQPLRVSARDIAEQKCPGLVDLSRQAKLEEVVGQRQGPALDLFDRCQELPFPAVSAFFPEHPIHRAGGIPIEPLKTLNVREVPL